MNINIKQRWYWTAVTLFFVAELLSWWSYYWHWTAAAMILVALLAVWLAWKKPVWLTYLTIAELVVGGKGYLFFINIFSYRLSVRYLLFTVLFLVTLPAVYRARREIIERLHLKPYLFFLAWIGLMIGWGWLSNHGLRTTFLDANAFIYLLILPAWWITLKQDPAWRSRLIVILLAGSTLVGLKSWLIVFLFGHNVGWLTSIYNWIRNTGVGEITHINTNVYRVFFQSQIYSLLAVALILGSQLQKSFKGWWWWPWLFSVLGVYISLSRSFWVGAIVLMVGLIVYLLIVKQPKNIGRLWIIIPALAVAWFAYSAALYIPKKGAAAIKNNVILARLKSNGSADAATARTNQIKPLFTAISQHPVLGSGFGQQVSYYSTDPRVRGWRNTDAFELGYLDLWLKLGLVGLGLFGWWIFSLTKQLYKTGWWVWLAGGSLALLTVNLFSPYLNHPLGIGWLMLVTLFAYEYERA